MPTVSCLFCTFFAKKNPQDKNKGRLFYHNQTECAMFPRREWRNSFFGTRRHEILFLGSNLNQKYYCEYLCVYAWHLAITQSTGLVNKSGKEIITRLSNAHFGPDKSFCLKVMWCSCRFYHDESRPQNSGIKWTHYTSLVREETTKYWQTLLHHK